MLVIRLIAALGAAATLVACGTGGGGGAGGSAQQAQPTQVTIETHEFKFGVSTESVSAGLVEITHQNAGKEPHQVQIFRLNDGVQFGEFKKTVTKDKTGLDTLAQGEPAGGTSEVAPGGSGTAWVDLDEGVYALVCFVQGHHAKGMVHPLEVGPAEEQEFAQPETDVEVAATEYAFGVPDDFSGGIVEFINNGEQAHEGQLFRVDATLQELQAYLKKPQGPPPGKSEPEGVGGAGAIAPGTSMTVDVGELEPGVYAFVCFIPDEQKKAPHFVLGMHHAFEVK